MGFVSVELHAKDNFPYLSVDPDFHVSLLPDLLKQVTVMSFAASYHWSQDIDPFIVVLGENHAGDLLFRVTHHLFACII